MNKTVLTYNVDIDQKTRIEVEYEGIIPNPTLQIFLNDNIGCSNIHCKWGDYYILTDKWNRWFLYNSNKPWWDAFLPLGLEMAAPYVAVQLVEWSDAEGPCGSGYRIFMENENDEIVHDVIVY